MGEGSSREMSQVEEFKAEPESQDAAMEDAPSPAPAAPLQRSKINLEDLFDDDEDSDGEFASSAPVKSEEEVSQPAPMYATHSIDPFTATDRFTAT